MSLRWQASVTGGEFRIFREKIIAGILKVSLVKGDAYGELNGFMLRFKNRGFWNRTTQILDIEGTRQFGDISYNFWKGTAVVNYEDKTYHWKYESWRRHKWQLLDGNDVVGYESTSLWKRTGNIDNEYLSPALVLAGLFIHSHFVRMTSTA